MNFLLCLMTFLLLVLLIVLFCAAVIAWDLFSIWIFYKIRYAFTYCHAYIYARIYWKKDRHKVESKLKKTKDELERMRHYRSVPSYYNEDRKDKLTWKKRGYEKGIQTSMLCNKK